MQAVERVLSELDLRGQGLLTAAERHQEPVALQGARAEQVAVLRILGVLRVFWVRSVEESGRAAPEDSEALVRAPERQAAAEQVPQE